MNKILIIICLFLGVTTVSAQRLKKQTITMEEFKQEVRENLHLDYSMSDYSISKIDSTVIGKHLASILNNLCKNYQQYVYLGKLSIIQSNQIEGINYCRIKKMKLHSVSKHGNEIDILFSTVLEPNCLNLKKSTLRFHFIDGISEDLATNELFNTLCKYTKEEI